LPDEMQDAEPDPSIKNGGFAIGEYFMNYCNSFNQPFSIPKKIVKIANYFLSRMDSFNSKVTLHNELR
jgi:hypothetical protein